MPKPKKDALEIKGLPNTITVDEDTTSSVDLSSVKLKYKGSKKDDITIILSADSGTFDVAGTSKVSVVGTGTGTIRLTGSAKDIEDFLNNANALQYTGAPNASGDNAANFTLSAEYGTTSLTLATIQADITDFSDDQTGTEGDDILTGDHGANTLLGLGGNDTLNGLAGVDVIDGGNGNDVVRGGAGADTLIGGAGEDTLQYEGSPSGVTVDLNADGSGAQSAFGGDATGDTISEFENVYGTEFADVLIGNAEDNVLFGYGGTDVIDGGAGDDVIRGGADADILTGGAGEDWLRYLGSTTGVSVDLNLNAAGFHQTSGGDAEGDIASGFENIYGSDFGDVLTGDSGANYLIGYGGDDTIDGGAGNDTIRGGSGADTLIGGAGVDMLQYEGSTSGVTVDLSLDGSLGAQQVSSGDAAGDRISGIENVTGTEFNDVITGNNERNYLLGLDGDDNINGGGGNDAIRGGAGADTMVGGAGSDVLQYAGSASGVTVNLTADSLGFQQASGGDAEGDIISEFENVYGSSFDDVITGNASRNILYGYGGNDTLDGGAGNDVLRGSAGADTFVFSTLLGAGNVDSIVDFIANDDAIHLNSSIFGGLTLGDLDATLFVSNGSGLADTAAQRIIYDSATGNLSFDIDGNGAEASVLFATLTAGLSIDETDFFVI